MPHITHNEIATFAAIEGEGPPLILIHGAEADHSMFRWLLPHLAPRFRCIAYDQRDSGATRNPAAEYAIEDLADDVSGLIAALGLERAHVFGTSLGSVIAQNLAVRHPTRVDRLILASAMQAGRMMADYAPERAQKFAALRADPVANADALAACFFPPAFLATNPGLFAALRSVRTPEQSARRAGLLRRRYALDLAAIAAPTLVIAGAEDGVVPPEHTLSLADAIPGAVRVLLPGIGHVAAAQAPDVLASTITRFLAGGSDPCRHRAAA